MKQTIITAILLSAIFSGCDSSSSPPFVLTKLILDTCGGAHDTAKLYSRDMGRIVSVQYIGCGGIVGDSVNLQHYKAPKLKQNLWLEQDGNDSASKLPDTVFPFHTNGSIHQNLTHVWSYHGRDVARCDPDSQWVVIDTCNLIRVMALCGLDFNKLLNNWQVLKHGRRSAPIPKLETNSSGRIISFTPHK